MFAAAAAAVVVVIDFAAAVDFADSDTVAGLAIAFEAVAAAVYSAVVPD